MAESTRRIPVPGHPGIYRKGNRYVVRFRHHGTLHSKSFRTLSEAARFQGRVKSGDTQPTSREPLPDLCHALASELQRQDGTRLKRVHQGELPGRHRAMRHPVLPDDPA